MRRFDYVPTDISRWLALSAVTLCSGVIGCATPAWNGKNQEEPFLSATATNPNLASIPATGNDRASEFYNVVAAAATRDDTGATNALVQPALAIETQPSVDVSDSSAAPKSSSENSPSNDPAVQLVPPQFDQNQGITCDELVELALVNNPAIQALAATTQKAAGFRTQVGLYANPVVGYQGQQLADQGTDQHLVYAEQEFVTANKLGQNRAVLNEALRAQLFELEARRLGVQADVRSAFLEALAIQRQLELIEEYRKLIDRAVEVSAARFKAGEGSNIDVLQTQVQQSEISLSKRQSDAAFAAKWREIISIVGLPTMAPERLVGELPMYANVIEWDSLAETLTNSSPEYAAAQARIQQARLALQRQGIQAIPNFTVQFAAGVDNGTDSGMMNLQVGAPIPVHNQNQGNIAAAHAELCRAIKDAERVAYAIRSRVATVSGDYTQSAEAIAVYRDEILPSAKKAFNLAEEAYKAGEMDFIQLLDARRTYIDANLQFVIAQSRLAVAQNKLDAYVLSGALQSVEDGSGDDSLRGQTFGQQ